MKIKIIQNYLNVFSPQGSLSLVCNIHVSRDYNGVFSYKTKNINLVFSVKLSSLVHNLYVLLNKKVNMRNLYSYRKVHKSIDILHV
jgi:uncharacterized lipoprotein YajG